MNTSHFTKLVCQRLNTLENKLPMVQSFVIFLLLNIFIGVNFTAIAETEIEKRLIHRNYYWYTKGKEERQQNGLTPFDFDHLPAQTVLCVILHKTISCDEVMKALKHYKEYQHTDQFS
uniref:Uncharacterized protein n=1 Tax=Onchocerca volvulus TaxID=6282 RepID=A0A8R1TK93_ONCVO